MKTHSSVWKKGATTSKAHLMLEGVLERGERGLYQQEKPHSHWYVEGEGVVQANEGPHTLGKKGRSKLNPVNIRRYMGEGVAIL